MWFRRASGRNAVPLLSTGHKGVLERQGPTCAARRGDLSPSTHCDPLSTDGFFHLGTPLGLSLLASSKFPPPLQCPRSCPRSVDCPLLTQALQVYKPNSASQPRPHLLCPEMAGVRRAQVPRHRLLSNMGKCLCGRLIHCSLSLRSWKFVLVAEGPGLKARTVSPNSLTQAPGELRDSTQDISCFSKQTVNS